MNKFIRILAAGAFAAALASSASAQIIYVDVTDGALGNTSVAPSAGGGVWTSTGANAVDGLWRLRPGFGQYNGTYPVRSGAMADLGLNAGVGTVYEAGAAGAETAQRLSTTLGGLGLDTYDVYAYFWSDQSSSPWTIRTSLTDSGAPGSLPLFIGGSTPSGTPLPTNIGTDSAGRIFWQINLGQITGTGFSIFVENDPTTTQGGNGRTWYDGVGYAVVPEPTTMALLGLGTLAGTFILRRRKS